MILKLGITNEKIIKHASRKKYSGASFTNIRVTQDLASKYFV